MTSPVRRLCGLLVRRPVWAAAATVALAAYPAASGDVAASYHVTPADAGAVLFTGLALFSAIRYRRGLPRRLAVAFGILAVALAVAALTAADGTAGLSGFVRYSELVVVLPAAVVISLRDRHDYAVLGGALVVLALVEGAIGTWQALTRTGASVGGQDVRAVGTFGALDITGMAQAVGFGVVVAFGYGLSAARGTRRAAAFAVAAVLLVPMAYSQSRGAWLATAVALLVMLALHRPWTALRAAVVVTVGVLAVVGAGTGAGGGVSAGSSPTAAAAAGGSPQLGERLTSLGAAVGLGSGGADQSVQDRYGLWRAAYAIWRQHPVLGVGLKEFPEYRDANAPMDLSAYSDADAPGLGYVREPLLTPHNVYLLVLSEQGLLGAAVFGVLVAVVVAGVVAGLRDPAVRRRGAGPAVAGFLVWQGTDFLYADLGGITSVLTALCFGAACAWSAPARARRKAGPA